MLQLLKGQPDSIEFIYLRNAEPDSIQWNPYNLEIVQHGLVKVCGRESVCERERVREGRTHSHTHTHTSPLDTKGDTHTLSLSPPQGIPHYFTMSCKGVTQFGEGNMELTLTYSHPHSQTHTHTHTISLSFLLRASPTTSQ
jgi:hypothetical protein